MVDRDDVPTPEELAAAEALRDGLAEDPLALALRAAHRPAELDAGAHAAILADALMGEAPPAPVTDLSARRAARRTLVLGVGTSALVLAASVLVWIGAQGGRPPEEIPLARVRSTAPLFSEPFKAGEASARIDAIAAARAADLRGNLFAARGVR